MKPRYRWTPRGPVLKALPTRRHRDRPPVAGGHGVAVAELARQNQVPRSTWWICCAGRTRAVTAGAPRRHRAGPQARTCNPPLKAQPCHLLHLRHRPPGLCHGHTAARTGPNRARAHPEEARAWLDYQGITVAVGTRKRHARQPGARSTGRAQEVPSRHEPQHCRAAGHEARPAHHPPGTGGACTPGNSGSARRGRSMSATHSPMGYRWDAPILGAPLGAQPAPAAPAELRVVDAALCITYQGARWSVQQVPGVCVGDRVHVWPAHQAGVLCAAAGNAAQPGTLAAWIGPAHSPRHTCSPCCSHMSC